MSLISEDLLDDLQELAGEPAGLEYGVVYIGVWSAEPAVDRKKKQKMKHTLKANGYTDNSLAVVDISKSVLHHSLSVNNERSSADSVSGKGLYQ